MRNAYLWTPLEVITRCIYLVVYNWPQLSTVIFLDVCPLFEPKPSIFFTISIPSVTLPNTTCLPSSLQEYNHSLLNRTNATKWDKILLYYSKQILTIQFSQYIERTESHLYWDQHLPWTRCLKNKYRSHQMTENN